VTNRLFADEAPYAASFVDDLASVDAVGEALGLLRAEHERRLVEAFGHILVGQILRRAADFMEAYARTRDPVTRFDVLNMLVHAEDLVGLAGRLVRHAVGGAAGRTRTTPSFSSPASRCRPSWTGSAPSSPWRRRTCRPPWRRRRRQRRRVHQAPEADKAGVPVRRPPRGRHVPRPLGRPLATDPPPVRPPHRDDHGLGDHLASVQEQATALYEMADGLGWHELAGRLLERLRLSALAADATGRA
jgi:hypothetical protein